ncbi:YceI family protein [Paraneptunicella aestuarii]|uniref:YceI family protein n=1 Tax=Paraneptunicella aestuarii TaxID=2831148 RepID=UPI001E5B1FAD|nr:YceI family protein [Paraneptunicella aestuarii]UAA37750.1 YceI family protein [Paraneptunicella aestuarii]
MKKILTLTTLLSLSTLFSSTTQAADYIIDTQGAHAFVNFKISHLGFSWVTGRFNTFDGTFSYDAEKPNEASIVVNLDTTSFDSNHALRDKHIKDAKYLNVEKYPTAKFQSTSITDKGNGKLAVKGNLTLHGVTKEIMIDAEKIGEGKDPWGGYRAGFSGTTSIKLSDYGIKQPGPDSTHAELELHVEGIRK